MPTPRSDESESDFISRCMGDSEAMEDFPEPDQRLAFCYSKYREKSVKMDMAKFVRISLLKELFEK